MNGIFYFITTMRSLMSGLGVSGLLGEQNFDARTAVKHLVHGLGESISKLLYSERIFMRI
jgi:hypothetical protein